MRKQRERREQRRKEGRHESRRGQFVLGYRGIETVFGHVVVKAALSIAKQHSLGQSHRIWPDCSAQNLALAIGHL